MSVTLHVTYNAGSSAIAEVPFVGVVLFPFVPLVAPAGAGVAGLAFLYCNPPTTPPTTAAAMTNASINPKSSQKCFLFSPQILLSRGAGGISAGRNTLSTVWN